jgi:hypothetical protein
MMSEILIVSYVALWVLVVLQALILLGLTRAFAEMRGIGEKPSLTGRPVPRFSALDLAGNVISSETISGSPATLLFVSPTCASCRVTLGELRGISSDSSRDLFVVCTGSEDACRELADDYGPIRPVLLDADGELRLKFGVTGTPMAVRIGTTGVIQSYGEPVRGEELAEMLASSAANSSEKQQIGDKEALVRDLPNV